MRITGNKILIKKTVKENVTSGGIILLSEPISSFYEGEIVTCGKGHNVFGKHIDFDVLVGDKVLFVKHHQGTEIELDGQTHFILEERDILAKINADNSLTPLNDILLCEPVMERLEEKGIIVSISGIRQNFAKIIAIGRGIQLNGIYYNDEFIKDEYVLFESNRGINIEWENKKYTFLGMHTILAVTNDISEVIADNNIF